MLNRFGARSRRGRTCRRSRSRRSKADSLPTRDQDLQRQEELKAERVSSRKVSVVASLGLSTRSSYENHPGLIFIREILLLQRFVQWKENKEKVNTYMWKNILVVL